MFEEGDVVRHYAPSIVFPPAVVLAGAVMPSGLVAIVLA